MATREIDQSCLQVLKKADGHKFDHGHALVLSGKAGQTGAARLSARAALRIGAGLVTLGSPRSAMAENAAQVTAIMLRQVDGGHGLVELLEDPRITAICLGPGLGLQADTQALVLTALAANRASVVDADALSRFQRHPDALFDALHPHCVLTPHGGEFARLFPDLAEGGAAGSMDKVSATQDAARRAGCTVLFKGIETVIADPNGDVARHAATGARHVPWLATAGAGDVLSGLITGLMARGIAPMRAAETATYVHVECALAFGPGLIAEDLPEILPSVLAKL